MFRTIYFYLFGAVGFLTKTPYLRKADKLRKSGDIEKHDEFVHNIVNKWAINVMKRTGSTINIIGEENIPSDENVLFVSNHQGNLDTPIYLAYIKKQKGLIGKSELQSIPILPIWMEHLDCILINRSNMRDMAKSILTGIEMLKNGKSLVVFPEGKRSKSKEMLEFKAGSFKLATKSKATIVPITLNGSYKIMEAQKFLIKPAKIDIIIHKPIITRELSAEEINVLPETVKSIIEDSLKNL